MALSSSLASDFVSLDSLLISLDQTLTFVKELEKIRKSSTRCNSKSIMSVGFFGPEKEDFVAGLIIYLQILLKKQSFL